MPKVSQQAIAEAAGVCKATVSLALRNDPQIPAKTQKKIAKIAKQMGYQRNPLVSAHMAQMRSLKPIKYQATIAFLIDEPVTHKALTSMLPVGRYYRGAQTRAQSQGFQLEVYSTYKPEHSTERFKKILHSRGIQGIIFGPIRATEPRPAFSFDLESFSPAACGAYLGELKALHHASPENYDSIRHCISRMHETGSQRIGLVISEESILRGDGRAFAAYLLYQNDILKPNRIPPLFLERWDENSFREWYQAHQPDGIVTSWLYSDMIPWFKSNKIAVPESVQVSTYYITPHIHPGISGIDQKLESVGAAAVDLIVGQLYRNEKGIPKEPKNVIISGEWIAGKTVRATTDKTKLSPSP